MPTHWTYEAFAPGSDLLQGDVLEPTGSLRSILKEVHPHFLDPKYTAFLVVTQSCDLAVRKGRFNTGYLNIAVIRPIAAVLHDFLIQVCRPVREGVYLRETKSEAYRLLERVFNQNEQALGLFYLHPDVGSGIGAPSAALLRVTVTLRVEHYQVLKVARRGRLSSEFRSKLGWLVGNLYSRIGTQDWSEPEDRSKEMEKLVKACLEPGDPSYGPIWVPEAWVAAAVKEGVRIEQLDRDKVTSTLEAHKPPTAKEQVIEQALRILKEVASTIDEDTLGRLRNRLNNDSVFAKAVRSAKSE